MVHGRLWPAHPKPLPDELLSSWMVRVAETNAIKVQTMSRMLYGDRHTPWNRDIDRFAPKWLLKAICLHTGVTYWQAYRATLAVYRTRLYVRRRLSGQLSWVLPILSSGTKRNGYGMQFCPVCLGEDETPYFRKQWRLALYTYCPLHGVCLYDACPACGASICYFRKDFGREVEQAHDIAHCFSCGFDLRSADRAAPEMLDGTVHARFDSILTSLADTKPVAYSSEYGFFTVLHQLCRVMCMRQNSGRLQIFVNRQLDLGNDPVMPNSRLIEHLRVRDRHRLLSLALWLMVDLETRLPLAWKHGAVRYNLLAKDLDEMPTWFRAALEKCSNYRRGKPVIVRTVSARR